MEVLELDPPQLGVAEAGIFVADDDGTTILAGPFQHETEALAWIEKNPCSAMRRNQSSSCARHRSRCFHQALPPLESCLGLQRRLYAHLS